ncbi:SDR family oxidoreductase [Bacillus weihaiensis]|uniref:NAD(P)-binding domain-containing protein n=1 Tax=Bacillus weihaiensis TaxID=1547283 RepID=A0A1L3MT67_9BACI|nr:SDR family oxidoreductase [Bacillus weihaiensis]APH05538.1 hypothetical protein A9C19_12680 [Bacillus weihaiensis]
MNILIIGANGHTGRNLISQLKQNNQHETTAMVREEKQGEELKELGADHIVVANLEGDMEHAFTEIDACIFAAGSGSKTGPEKTISVDQEGAKKAIDLAKSNDIKHFVMLSSVGADSPEVAPEEMRHYLTAKQNADEYLMKSGVPYTIVRPTSLSNEKEQTLITAKVSLPDKSLTISREAVAKTLIASLTMMEAKNEVFEITSGLKEVEEALKYIH